MYQCPKRNQSGRAKHCRTPHSPHSSSFFSCSTLRIAVAGTMRAVFSSMRTGSTTPTIGAILFLGFNATLFRSYLCMNDPQWLAHALMMAGIALTFARRHIWGVGLIAVAVAVKATAGLALPFMVWVWMRHLRDRRGYSPMKAFAAATAASAVIFVAVFAVLSWLAGVGLGWLTALAGSVKIINWLTLPTAAANLVNVFASLLLPVNFYAVLDVARIIGIAIIAVSLPLLWWRFRHTDREALIGIALVMIVVVLFVPAALPWYYTWPLAVLSALAQTRSAIALIAGFSTWIMVIFKPDGSHGMYSWLHVLLATTCAAAAWYLLAKFDVWTRVEPSQ